ncbi:NeuD/PglB/VioB family sugar acetyltransferase [Akkermansiaceae bacterium]|nr:NeuD/PglB/VioB family sugar acetyltransferase [Akkermansiaceae bacterium]
MEKDFFIVGYSGHSFVILDSALRCKLKCKGYYDLKSKKANPFEIQYLGTEENISAGEEIMITIGDNQVRKRIYEKLVEKESITFLNIVDPKASLSNFAKLKLNSSVFIGPNSVVNSFAEIELAAIINTGAIVEHEAKIGEFSHVGPNATVCGGAQVGANVFVGANAVIKQGIRIGDNSIVGAGAVVMQDLQANSTYVGNPAVKIH